MQENHEKAPLAEAIEEYISAEPARFHMPGHKGKSPFAQDAKKSALFETIWRADVTETANLDILAAPTGVIQEAQAACAS